MTKPSTRRLLLASVPLIALLVAATGLWRVPASWIQAAILHEPNTGFAFWYLSPADGTKTIEIPKKTGAPIELPLGITTPNGQLTSPLDSIEFRFSGIPDFLGFRGAAAFPGFHVDTHQREGTRLETYDLSIFVTPEVFQDEGALPGAPSIDSLGDLIEATDEILRLEFTTVSEPVADLAPISLSAIVTERDGDFTRHLADGDLSLPGANAGTITLSIVDTDFPQITTAYPVGTGKVAIEFTQPVMAGTAATGAENTDNYFIYKCGAHLPAPDPLDPRAEDAEGCQALNQGSVTEPGVPTSAQRDAERPNIVVLSLPADRPMVGGAKYVVLARKLGDETGSHFLPEGGIYSQIFTWTPYPVLQSVVPMAAERIDLVFAEPLCAATGSASPADAAQYRLIACAEGMTPEACVGSNADLPDNPIVTAATYDGERKVVLTVSGQSAGAAYLLTIKNLQNGECQPASAIPADPAYTSPLFSGYDTAVEAAPLAVMPSATGTIHLPWREILELSPAGGKAPYTFAVVPPEAGTVDYDAATGKAVFRPLLVDNNNQSLHDERDALVRVTDYLGATSDLNIHILRRGDLGGREERLLDKTDVQDVNDISAGWKR